MKIRWIALLLLLFFTCGICEGINLNAALKSGLPVVVKLGSDRCPPCRKMDPIFKELSNEQKGKAVFLNLDVYENRELSNQYQISLIPTLLYFDKKGKFRDKTVGFMDKKQILRKMQELRLTK